jgi:acyl carrier protein
MSDLSTQEALDLLADVAGVLVIGPLTPFGTLDLDSLMLIEWISLLEDKLDTEFNIRDLDMFELRDLPASDVVDVLRKRAVTG